MFRPGHTSYSSPYPPVNKGFPGPYARNELKKGEEDDDEEDEENEEDEDEDYEEEEEEEEEKKVVIPGMGTGNALLDQMTMELMVSKTVYNKYLSKADPSKFQEKQHFANQVRLRADKIRETVELCIDKLSQGPLQEEDMLGLNQSIAINPDIMACFEQFSRQILHDLDLKTAAVHDQEMFGEGGINNFSLDNFEWRQHGVRVQKSER